MAQILFKNARLLDPRSDALAGGTSVLVEGEHVREVSTKPIKAAKAAVIDCKGRTLMPGLIDCHVHAMLSEVNIRYLEAIPLTMMTVRAASLARFIQDEKLPRPKFRTIMACAGTVTAEFRKILQETFAAEVFDKYGSRECSDMACECERHNGLHVLAPNVYLEIVDDLGRDCPAGGSGRILVTLLNNPGFPMIRYEIGDLATRADAGLCPCGSSFPRIASLQGRQDDMLTTEDGTLQTSGFVRHFVGVSLNRQLIQEWQLEQTDRARFVFRYVAQPHAGLEDNLKRLKQSFQLVFGPSAVVEMRPVDEIPPSPSGKVRWIINSYRQRQGRTSPSSS